MNGLSIYMVKIHNIQVNVTWCLSQLCSLGPQCPSPGPPVVGVSCIAFQRNSISISSGPVWKQERQVPCVRLRQSYATARWTLGFKHECCSYLEGEMTWGAAALKAIFVSRLWCYDQPTCSCPGISCPYSEMSHQPGVDRLWTRAQAISTKVWLRALTGVPGQAT